MKLVFPVLRLPWRSIQIAINVITVVFGFMTFLPLSYVKYYFKQQCVLYAHPVFKSHNSHKTADVLVDLRGSEWGSTTACNFATFQPVIVCIHAFIWCWYLLLMKTQLKNEKKEYTILFPCFITHALVFITVFVSSSMIQAGLDVWCSAMTKELFVTYHKRYTCSDSETLLWDLLEQKHKFYTFLLVAKISSWLLTLAVLLQTLVSGYKIYLWIIKNKETAAPLPAKSPQRTYDSTSADVNVDEPTFTSEIDWDNDDSTCETSRAISFNV